MGEKGQSKVGDGEREKQELKNIIGKTDVCVPSLWPRLSLRLVCNKIIWCSRIFSVVVATKFIGLRRLKSFGRWWCLQCAPFDPVISILKVKQQTKKSHQA